MQLLNQVRCYPPVDCYVLVLMSYQICSNLHSPSSENRSILYMNIQSRHFRMFASSLPCRSSCRFSSWAVDPNTVMSCVYSCVLLGGFCRIFYKSGSLCNFVRFFSGGGGVTRSTENFIEQSIRKCTVSIFPVACVAPILEWILKNDNFQILGLVS